LNNIYIPSLQEKIRSLGAQLNLVEDCLQEVLTQTPQALQRREVQLSLQPLIPSAPTGTHLHTPETREAYAAEVTDYIDTALLNLGNMATRLSAGLDNLDVLGSGNGSEFVDDIEKQINSKQAELTTLTPQHSHLAEEKNVLDSAMRVFEDKNLLDELKPLVETFKYLNPKSPSVSAIRAGVAGVQNILRISSESVKYSDLVEARAELQRRLEARNGEMRKTQQLISTLTARRQQLGTVQSLKQHIVGYEQEIRKITTTLDAFLNASRNAVQDNIIEYAQAFITRADALAAYLEDLRRRWN
ncbi:MAG: binary cytotoxin component, partial [Pseudomonas sp.]|nr:binary cytotoxin component [Pseudomonas sp.]